MQKNTWVQIISDEAAMLAIGTRLAKACPKQAMIFLYGDLGAGKTTLARGFLRGLDYTGKVKSPTYTIVEPYIYADHQVFHFDLYRINDPEELEHLGIRDYQTGLCLIEWPEHGAYLLPAADLSCYIEPYNQSRQIKLVANTPKGQTIMQNLLETLC